MAQQDLMQQVKLSSMANATVEKKLILTLIQMRISIGYRGIQDQDSGWKRKWFPMIHQNCISQGTFSRVHILKRTTQTSSDVLKISDYPKVVIMTSLVKGFFKNEVLLSQPYLTYLMTVGFGRK